METKATQNGTVKRMTTAKKQEIAKKKAATPPASKAEETSKEKVEEVTTKIIPVKTTTLEDRLSSFEKLKGLTSQRERLVGTLDELNKFKYQNADSSVFHLKDENGQEFKTTNNNLIKLVTDVLQEQLTTRKDEIEKDILEFPM